MGCRWKEKAELWGAEGEEEAAFFWKCQVKFGTSLRLLVMAGRHVSSTQYLVYTGPGVTRASGNLP